MLTYHSSQSSSLSRSPEKPWLLLLLAFAWLWPGIIHRDLWKPDEPLIYTAISQIVQTQNYLSPPNIFGEFYLQHSPLFLWLGSFSKQLFSPHLMSDFTAIRLITVFFMVMAFCCLGGAGRELLGRRNGRSVVLILLGSPGIIIFGHMMSYSPILLAGLASCMYGFALFKQKSLCAGILLGIGTLLTFLSANIPLFLFIFLITISLTFHPYWRIHQYLLTCITAAVIVFPILIGSILSFASSKPQLFQIWLSYYSLNEFGGMDNIKIGWSFLELFETIIWFTFPAWPLTIWTIYQKNIFKKPVGFLCFLWIGLALIYLVLQKNIHNDSVLILIIPLAILGAAQLDDLKRGFAAYLNWFGIMTFGALAIFIWLGFFAMNYGVPAKLSERFFYFSPYYQSHWNYFPILIALSFTPIWLLAVTRKNIKGRQAITNWAAGMTFIWTLILTLFLPWLDAIKSYRPVVTQMESALSPQLKQNLIEQSDCIISNNRNILMSWSHYGNIPVHPLDHNKNCQYRLVSRINTQLVAKPGWEIIWIGSRPREKNEIFMLWKRVDNTPILKN